MYDTALGGLYTTYIRLIYGISISELCRVNVLKTWDLEAGDVAGNPKFLKWLVFHSKERVV